MSHRTEQVSEVIRHEISRLLLTEVEFPKNCLVTITRVSTSPDLRHAKILVSVMPVAYTGKALERLRQNAGQLQFQLNQKLSLKPLPRISFGIDATEKQAAEIEALLDRIKETD